MAKRRRKLFRIMRPRAYVSSKGVRWQAPYARIGDKVGLNIGRRGISASVRTRLGSFNSRRGLYLRMPRFQRAGVGTTRGGCCCCVVPFFGLLLLPLFGLVMWRKVWRKAHGVR